METSILEAEKTLEVPFGVNFEVNWKIEGQELMGTNTSSMTDDDTASWRGETEDKDT